MEIFISNEENAFNVRSAGREAVGNDKTPIIKLAPIGALGMAGTLRLEKATGSYRGGRGFKSPGRVIFPHNGPGRAAGFRAGRHRRHVIAGEAF